MDRHRHGAEFGADQHHHRTLALLRPFLGEMAEKLGVAGIGETALLERVLVDRIGHQRRGVTGADVDDGALDRLGDELHIG